MSASSGPSILTNGLVFDYDMSNTKKSWIGKPATNTCSFGTYDYGYNSTKISNATPPSPPPVTGYPIYKITSNDGNDSQQILYTATVDQVNGGTYTHSAYVYLESGTWVSAGQHWNPWDYGTQQFIPRGVWTRIEDPVTNSPNNYGAVAMCYNTNGAVYVTASQYELGSVASPFITQSNGVRSNTQAITDLTNKNTITASSLTYAADNTFSFNGSNNFVDGGNSSDITITNNITVSAWVRRTAYTGSNSMIIRRNDRDTYALQLGISTPEVWWKLYFGSSTWGQTATTSLALNEWANIVGTYDRTTMRLYKNGVQVQTLAATSAIDYSGSAAPNLIIGRDDPISGRYFAGDIPSIQIYNRALSAVEVQQNFNAQRTRYGI